MIISEVMAGFSEIKIIENEKYSDHRGYFCVPLKESVPSYLGVKFVQENESYSHAGTFRGLHYQYDKDYPEVQQGKLVRVIVGTVIDFIMDIRVGSPTFGQICKYQLGGDSGDKIVSLYVPAGFAHGFYAVVDSIFNYKVTAGYYPQYEKCINWRSKLTSMEYFKTHSPYFISNKDDMAPMLHEISEDDLPKYEQP